MSDKIPNPQVAKETPAAVKPSPIDWGVAKAHIMAVEDAAMKTLGQPKCNPFIWIATNVKDLKTAAADTTKRTPELFSKIMALKYNGPTVSAPAK